MTKKPLDKKNKPATNGSAVQDLASEIRELTGDLQRTRADFENYRKRVETDLARARQAGKTGAILKLLPVIDNIERATQHVPEELAENSWAQGVKHLVKSLEKSLELLGLARIEAKPGMPFNPELREAIQAEEGDGEELIAEELQAGYTFDGTVLRHSLVKVKSS